MHSKKRHNGESLEAFKKRRELSNKRRRQREKERKYSKTEKEA